MLGIRGAGEMRVYLLDFRLVERDEPVEDVVAGSIVVITTVIVGEIFVHRAKGKLILKTIDLVEEEDDGGLHEPA